MTPIEPGDYNLNDGFSPGASILLRVPGVDLAMTGAAPITDMARSLDADAPVVLVNASTLAHHLMWAELDSNATSEATRALIIRPAVNLAEGTRYIVALRQMKDASGALIPPSADFLAYRDGTPTGDPVKEARRPHMEEIFTTLAAAGVGRSDLYLAWDFTVASQRNLTERMLFVRDDGFARLGAQAPNFTVTLVEDDVDSNIFRRVTGTYDVERYVDSTDAAGALRARTGRPARPSGDAAGRLVHLPHPARRAGERRRGRHAGTGVDLRTRPARVERRGQRRQRQGHGQRAQLRVLRDQVDRHVGRGHPERRRHPAGPRRSFRPSPTACSRRC